ncbi:MAG TPA: hypothetical protein VHB48_16435 [Chitinophagaceae bacterium]|nr:hypothetical protein [Chitinophagaceae bacterium]
MLHYDIKPSCRPTGHNRREFYYAPLSNDFESEAKLFKKRLAERGGTDLQMLGIATNGQIGINQPGTPFESETWVSPMDPDFEARVCRETQVPPETILGGLTRGIKNIMQTRKLILVKIFGRVSNLINLWCTN